MAEVQIGYCLGERFYYVTPEPKLSREQSIKLVAIDRLLRQKEEELRNEPEETVQWFKLTVELVSLELVARDFLKEIEDAI